MPTNPYELIFIVDAGAEETEIQRLTDETKRIVKEAGGEITKELNWGTRRLAFEIKKRKDGVYIHLEFNAPESVPDQLRVFYTTQISLLRHLILKIPKAKLLQEKIDTARKEKALREAEKKRQEELAAQKAAAEAAAEAAAAAEAKAEIAAAAEAQAKAEAQTETETEAKAESAETPPEETPASEASETKEETDESPKEETPAEAAVSEPGE